MAAVPVQTVSATGLLDLDPGSGGTTLAVLPGDTDIFVGFSGTYSGLTFQLLGSRTGEQWYDIATYTTDDIGPLAGPVAPADNAAVAYRADIRAFKYVQINIASLTSGQPTVEVMTGSFFPQRAGSSLSGALAQLIYEIRALRATLAGWLGLPAGPLTNLPNDSLGSGVGKSFPN